jgi:hypothetical protein
MEVEKLVSLNIASDWNLISGERSGSRSFESEAGSEPGNVLAFSRALDCRYRLSQRLSA